jgi:hypothetical protein
VAAAIIPVTGKSVFHPRRWWKRASAVRLLGMAEDWFFHFPGVATLSAIAAGGPLP